MLTYLLFLCGNYIFSLYGYTRFYQHDKSQSHYNGFCEGVFFCFLAHLDLSFKYDGGIGGFMVGAVPEEKYLEE